MSKIRKTACIIGWVASVVVAYVTGRDMGRGVSRAVAVAGDSHTDQQAKDPSVGAQDLGFPSKAETADSSADVLSKMSAICAGLQSPKTDEDFSNLCVILGRLKGKQAFEMTKDISGRLGELAKTGILIGWAKSNPEEAWAWAVERSSQLGSGAGPALSTASIKDLFTLTSELYKSGNGAAVAKLLAEMDMGATRDLVTGFYARMISRYDASAAVRYLATLDGSARGAAIQGVAHELAVEAPVQAADWALSLSPGEGKSVIRSVMTEWVTQDPKSAVNWIQSQKASAALDSAIDFLLFEAPPALVESSPEIIGYYSNAQKAHQAQKRLEVRRKTRK